MVKQYTIYVIRKYNFVLGPCSYEARGGETINEDNVYWSPLYNVDYKMDCLLFGTIEKAKDYQKKYGGRICQLKLQ